MVRVLFAQQHGLLSLQQGYFGKGRQLTVNILLVYRDLYRQRSGQPR